MRYSTSIGIDAHAKKNSICALVADTGEIVQAELSEDPAKLASWIRERGFPLPLRCCYEAGPTGFGLARALRAAGIECVVAAPSKLPRRTDRKKTDRVDAEWLARMLLSGSVRAVRVPSPEEESLRRLSHLRWQAAAAKRAARQRVSSMLLATGTKYALTKHKWTRTFVKWASALEFELTEDAFVFRSLLADALRAEERLDAIEAEIERVRAADEDLSRRMARFECIHGIGRVSAFALVSEVFDFERFGNGGAFASYVGLVPSEGSSGEKVRRGGLTKAGSRHLRRVLIEAAGCYSKPFKAVRREDARVPEAVRAKAEKCARRLRKRRLALRERGVADCKAKVAVARELCEWIYWIAVMPA